MTIVADTRFLLVHTFPASEKERSDIRELMRDSLKEHLVIPTVVLVEFLKTAGKTIGKQGALTRILILKEDGARIYDIDEGTALLAGELLLKDERRSIGDALIAASATVLHASHVITDDTHFRDLGMKTKWV